MKKVLVMMVSASVIGLMASCGGDTQKTETTAATATEQAAPAATEAVTEIPADIQALLQKHTCLTCHNPDKKVVGPPYREVAQKNYTAEQIVELVHKPMPEHWAGYPPMAPLPNVPAEDIVKIANWINTLK